MKPRDFCFVSAAFFMNSRTRRPVFPFLSLGVCNVKICNNLQYFSKLKGVGILDSCFLLHHQYLGTYQAVYKRMLNHGCINKWFPHRSTCFHKLPLWVRNVEPALFRSVWSHLLIVHWKEIGRWPVMLYLVLLRNKTKKCQGPAVVVLLTLLYLYSLESFQCKL